MATLSIVCKLLFLFEWLSVSIKSFFMWIYDHLSPTSSPAASPSPSADSAALALTSNAHTDLDAKAISPGQSAPSLSPCPNSASQIVSITSDDDTSELDIQADILSMLSIVDNDELEELAEPSPDASYTDATSNASLSTPRKILLRQKTSTPSPMAGLKKLGVGAAMCDAEEKVKVPPFGTSPLGAIGAIDAVGASSMNAALDFYCSKVEELKQSAIATMEDLVRGIDGIDMPPLDTDSMIFAWDAISAAHELVLRHPAVGVKGGALQTAACDLVKMLISAENAVYRLPAFAEEKGEAEKETSPWGWVPAGVISAIERGEKIWFLEGLHAEVHTIIDIVFETVDEQRDSEQRDSEQQVVVMPTEAVVPGFVKGKSQPQERTKVDNMIMMSIDRGVTPRCASGEVPMIAEPISPGEVLLRMGSAGSLLGDAYADAVCRDDSSGVTSGVSTPRSIHASVVHQNEKHQVEKRGDKKE